MVRARHETRERLRWETVEDGGPQQQLFGSRAERITHPEFRDLEFIHVRAKTIINEVPAASRMPFRHTINVYRGCSHACSYCLTGDTPILMGDGRTKPLADVRPGDEVYGTVRRGNYRRYVRTEVLDHWTTVKPAYRVTLEDGTQLIASGDHRFLSNRGWKHVVGAEQGPLQRPFLTTNNKLIGTGGFAEPPKDDEEYRRAYLCGMIRGDGHVGTYTYDRPTRRSPDVVHRFRLALVDLEALDRAREYLDGFGIATQSFDFHKSTTYQRRPMRAIRTSSAEGVDGVRRIIEWPRQPSSQWRKGFLAGIFDAEGSCSGGILRISNTDPAIIDQLTDCFDALGFDAVIEVPGKANGMRVIRLRGGLRERLRFFHMVDPAITRKKDMEGIALKSDAPLGVVSVEPLGIDLPMYDIATGTGDFIANGVVSHNCFARPSHEYLNLDAGRDFERVIVVKVNAVERLRAEIASGRWGGDHIAMGTNTDPYQRAEGRYRLTRGVLEVLTAAGNPFSLLTKSSLVVRDLDILKEANERTDIAVNFSIASLDPEVWRTTEPGAPNPRSRVEALAKIREAGIPAGVLVAPVQPGINDRREQLAEVVKACVDAGATSISPITLHLRPGVKEQFMPWLEEERPELLPLYHRLYPRSYAPKDEQARIAQMVRELVEEHGGVSSSPGRARRIRPPSSPARREPDPDEATEQLDLSL